MGVDSDSILGKAISEVETQMSNLSSLTTSYTTKLNSALSTIAGVSLDEVTAPDKLSAPDVTTPSISLGDVPTYTASTLSMPDTPTLTSIDSLLADLDIDGMDDLPDTPTAISINIPDAPTMATIEVPTRPDIDTTVTMPDEPDISMPEMDALLAINLPEFTFPTLPTFTDQPPDASGLTVPSPFINWAEPHYRSEVLDAIQAQVRAMMAGGTGIPPAVQDALFATMRERDAAETERDVQSAVDTWASRGFSMPPGMLIKQAAVIRENGRLKAAETNRDIFTQAAQWEIDAVRFAVQQGIALEQLTTNLYTNMVGRLFEVARFQAESQINVFNAQVSLFNAQNQAYQTLAEVYKTKVEAAISKLTAYKTAVDAQVAISGINAQKVEIFKARIQAVQENVEVYKALMQGASIRSEVIKNQFDAYRTEVEAYGQEISAQKVKFEAYTAQVQGEEAKANIYDAQVRAYSATVGAIAQKADVQVKAVGVKLDAAKTYVQKYQADVQGYQAEIQASLSELQYQTTVFTAKVDAWKSEASAYIAEAEMESRYADMATRTNIAYAEMQIKQYEANVQKSVSEANIALEAAKAVGQYTAQLAAGALSAAHVSASISGSGSATTSDTTSTTTSTTTSKNYSY